MEELIFENKKYISTRRAALLLKCTNDYAGKLARQGKISAIRHKNFWFIEEEAILNYLRESTLQKEIQRKELAKQREIEYRARQQSLKVREQELVQSAVSVPSMFTVAKSLMLTACFIIAFALKFLAGNVALADTGVIEIAQYVADAAAENAAQVSGAAEHAVVLVGNSVIGSAQATTSFASAISSGISNYADAYGSAVAGGAQLVSDTTVSFAIVLHNTGAKILHGYERGIYAVASDALFVGDSYVAGINSTGESIYSAFETAEAKRIAFVERIDRGVDSNIANASESLSFAHNKIATTYYGGLASISNTLRSLVDSYTEGVYAVGQSVIEIGRAYNRGVYAVADKITGIVDDEYYAGQLATHKPTVSEKPVVAVVDEKEDVSKKNPVEKNIAQPSVIVRGISEEYLERRLAVFKDSLDLKSEVTVIRETIEGSRISTDRIYDDISDSSSEAAEDAVTGGNLSFTGINGTFSGDVAITGALNVTGTTTLSGPLSVGGSAGDAGYVLQSTGTGAQWVATSTLGISSGGAVDSVNGQTGVVVISADDIDDASTTNKFVSMGDIVNLSNLSGINTGDQTITLTGDVTGTGTSTFATTIASGLSAAKIADGSISNAEFQYLDGVTSAIQTQLNSKQATITTGTTAQYFKGDLSLGTFPTAVSSFVNDTGFITSTVADGLTLSGSASNIALGSNYLSGDGDDEGIRVSSAGYVGIGVTPSAIPFEVYNTGLAQVARFTGASNAYVAVYGGTKAAYFQAGGGTGNRIGSLTNDPIEIVVNATAAITANTLRNVGIGTTAPTARVHVVSTSEQLRVGYDTSNFFSTTVADNGVVTFDANGTGPTFSFSDAISATNFSGSSSGTNTGDQTIMLTGDVTGSGTGSFAATLANTGVTAGSYTNADITVDAKGRITAVANGSGGGGGGGGTWGSITGTLSDQTDLQTALNDKYDAANFNTDFDTQFGLKNSDNLSEGVTNLYFSDARAITALTGQNISIFTNDAGYLKTFNGLTVETQNFAVGTSGTDFNIVSDTATHTFNIPDASDSARGFVSTGTQTFAGEKTFVDDVAITKTTPTLSFISDDVSSYSSYFYRDSSSNVFALNSQVVRKGIPSSPYSTSIGTGNRTGSITITTAGAFTGTISTLIDGAITNGVFFNNAQATSGYNITFDFGTPKAIREIRWRQQAITSQGVWQVQVSSNGSSYSNLGTTFTLGSSATQTITTIASNTTAYRYYRLQGVSGTTSSGPWLHEVEFDEYDPTSDSIEDTQFVKTSDGTTSGEKGVLELGSYSGSYGTANIYDGLSHRFNILGTQVASLSSAAVSVTGTLTSSSDITSGTKFLSAVGSASAPAYSFTSDTNTGIYGTGADQIDIATAGVVRVQISNSTTRMQFGSVSVPGIGFTADTDQGIYGASGTVGISTGSYGAIVATTNTTTHSNAVSTLFNTNSVSALQMLTTGVVFNESGADRDFRIEGDTEANLFVVDASADKIGIGTLTPSFPLDVASTASSAQTYGFLSSSGTVGTSSGTNSYSIRAVGRILAPEFNAVSDGRLKDINFDLDSYLALDLIAQMKPVSFNWLAEPDGKPVLGFIAQDVQSIIPNAVSYIDGGIVENQLTLDYNQLTTVSIGAIKAIRESLGDSIDNLEYESIFATETESVGIVGLITYINEQITSKTKTLSDFVAIRITAMRAYVGDLFADKVTTNKLCIPDSNGVEVCLTGDQLRELLGEEAPENDEVEGDDTTDDDTEGDNDSADDNGGIETSDENSDDTTTATEGDGDIADDTTGDIPTDNEPVDDTESNTPVTDEGDATDESDTAGDAPADPSVDSGSENDTGTGSDTSDSDASDAGDSGSDAGSDSSSDAGGDSDSASSGSDSGASATE